MATDYQQSSASWIDPVNFLRSMASDVTPLSVIFEYIQNASDASAHTFIVDIGNDSLNFLHDGKPFDNNDINAFGKIAGTTKYFSGNQIGGFGRGAQSALFYCKELVVELGEYSLSIDPETFPFNISLHGGRNHGEWTKFVLKYREKTGDHFGVPSRAMSKSTWLEIINQSHDDLISLLTVLGGIREHVKQIIVRSDAEEHIYAVDGRSDHHLIVNFYSAGALTATHQFSFRSAETDHGTVTVGQFDQSFGSLSEGCFCSGLPMPISTKSRFWIDAAFKPDQTRHFIPFADREEQSQRNLALVRAAARIAAGWIESERDDWILNLSTRDHTAFSRP